MKKTELHTLLFIALCLVSLAGAHVAQAAANGLPAYSPLEPLGQVVGNLETGSLSDFPGLIAALIKLLLGLGAIVAVLSLVWGGIVYMTAEVVDKKSWATAKIRSAVWGLLILMLSWIFLNTINPQLLNISQIVPGVANGGLGTDTAPGADGGVGGGITSANACTTAGRTVDPASCATWNNPSGCVDLPGGSSCLP